MRSPSTAPPPDRSRAEAGFPPSPALLLLDGPRAAAEAGLSLLAWPWLRATARRGDGHPVLLLPGFLAGDELTSLARRFLRRQGFAPHGWHAGVNWGRWDALDLVIARTEALANQAGRKVSLVGASMGGLYARALARQRPELVRCIVTLGSAAHPPHRSNHVWPWYEALTGQPERTMHVPSPMPVPSTSVFSRVEGFSSWRPCVQPAGRQQENVGIVSSHMGMVCHPATLYLLADRLAQQEAAWKAFEPPALLRSFYEVIA
ncbi:alpha/beta hydrolase [Caenimonas sedimenti]|uniref:Alpha/beta hydrolase n=1 Tax=Caenimonas sedimenti TaxID=2596921 RepID=A0A562ZRU1_9BURK|nr:alpha/beta hydrolase [Caenimonas sedimenti]TWO70874.1 alpha/beta hydrolase [Caenimonas sedimenti]